ncbi:hypothetical protein [Sphingomonas azotifigens]|uniref:hypothetical protein n=1 Tax=Sphingomonas azotifigens TaxID=330920 RepID=UPI001C3FEA2A|nr:hypothetical protein [Sphingomonas azotifigens]
MRVLPLVVPVALMLAGSALAQQAPQEGTPPPVKPQSGGTGDPIIVTGRPLPPKAEIRSLTRAIAPPDLSDEPMPRFNDSVCFGSGGLDRPVLEAIGDRLAEDAELAGLRLAGDGCKPNVIVLFVDNVGSEVAALVRRKWWVFGDRSPSEIRTIVNEKGPVRAWSNSETRSRDGDRIDSHGVLRVPIASRIVTPVRRDVLASVVLVERAAVLGKSPRQIGDYVAMRSLAGVRPPRTTRGETILTLFDPGTISPASEMTRFDRGYLRGLYSGAPNTLASTTQGKIVREILKPNDKDPAGAAPR